MKKILFTLFLLFSINGLSQDDPAGKPSFKVFGILKTTSQKM